MVGTGVDLWVADFVVADKVDSVFGYCSKKGLGDFCSLDYRYWSMGYFVV